MNMSMSIRTAALPQRTKAALHVSEAKYRGLLEQAAAGIFVTDMQGNYLLVNPRYCQMLGCSEAELLGLNAAASYGEEDRKWFARNLSALHAQQRLVIKRTMRRSDGSFFPCEISVQMLGDGTIQGIARDLTEREQLLAALAEREQRSRLLLESTAEAIYGVDMDNRCTFVNPAFLRILGYGSAEDLIGKNLHALVHHSHAQGTELPESDCRILRALREGVGAHADDEVFWRADGTPIQVEYRALPIRSNGKVVGAVTTFLDITQRKRNEEDLRRFRAAMDISVDAITLVDRASMRYIDVNETACTWLGYGREELLALGPHDVLPLSRETIQRHYDDLIAGDAGAARFESTNRRKDGAEFPVEVVRCAIPSPSGHTIVATIRDISRRKQADLAIHRHAMRQSLMAELGLYALACTCIDELLQRAAEVVARGLDAPLCKLLRLEPDGRSVGLRAGIGWEPGWVGRTTALASEHSHLRHVLASREPLIVEDFDNDSRFARTPLLQAHAVASGVDVAIAGADGAYGVLGAYSRERDAFTAECLGFLQGVAHIVGTAIDRRQAEERMARLAHFDVLTGLPNRTLFRDRLAQTMMLARRGDGQAAVVVLNLDGFKSVNHNFGAASGDDLLAAVGQRISACLRSGDTLARLGSDEFAIVLARLAKADDATLVAQKIMGALNRPFHLAGNDVFMTASLGITLYPGDGEDADALVRNADVAMRRAKANGRNSCQFYLPQMNERSAGRMRTEAELRRALERNEFELHYQAKADLGSGGICGFEALLRWRHPVRGLVAPGEFISILEDTGLIVPVGEWVLRTACAQIAAWSGVICTPVSVAVNLSARQFQKDDLDALIAAILAETGADPRLLEIEITESMLMRSPDAAARMLRNLKAMGVRLAVDDFGTGYSSLAYLKRFPLDALKIDRAFIRDCVGDPEDAAITRAIIGLAHSLRLKVIAEGVETQEQLAFLRSHDCDQVQGYLFARPVEAKLATGMLRLGLALPTGAA